MTRSRKALAAVLGAAVVLAGISLASAAGLQVAGGSLGVVAAAHPCPGTASAVAVNTGGGTDYLGVMLALPSGCETKAVQLHVDRPNTTTDRDGTGTTDAAGVGSIRLNGTFRPTAANTFAATVDGWSLPIVWNSTLMPPIWCSVVDSPTASCTATVALFHGNKPGGGTFDYYDVVVTTTSPTYVQWEVGFKLNHAFYGTVPVTLGNSTLDAYYDGQTSWTGTATDVFRVSPCAQYPGTLLVRGTRAGGGNNFEDVKVDRERRFSLVLNYQEGTYDDVVDAACS